MTKCKLGSVVLSKNGKYDGELFIVTSIIDDDYCFIANGKQRKLCNPKKKKVKHLLVLDENIELEQKFKNNAYVLDSDIRKVISNYKNK